MIIINKFIRKENGSITLEAAMILPFFMLFIVFLATLIRIAVADMGLYKAASETSEIVVAYAYPAEIAKTSAEDLVKNKINSAMPGDIKVEEATKWASDGLIFFLDVNTEIEGFFEGLAEGPVQKMVRSKFEDATGVSNFNSEVYSY